MSVLEVQTLSNRFRCSSESCLDTRFVFVQTHTFHSAVFSYKILFYVNISENPDLVCFCELVWMQLVVSKDFCQISLGWFTEKPSEIIKQHTCLFLLFYISCLTLTFIIIIYLIYMYLCSKFKSLNALKVQMQSIWGLNILDHTVKLCGSFI